MFCLLSVCAWKWEECSGLISFPLIRLSLCIFPIPNSALLCLQPLSTLWTQPAPVLFSSFVYCLPTKAFVRTHQFSVLSSWVLSPQTHDPSEAHLSAGWCRSCRWVSELPSLSLALLLLASVSTEAVFLGSLGRLGGMVSTHHRAAFWSVRVGSGSQRSPSLMPSPPRKTHHSLGNTQKPHVTRSFPWENGELTLFNLLPDFSQCVPHLPLS